jgi:hypothetical protein
MTHRAKKTKGNLEGVARHKELVGQVTEQNEKLRVY